MVIVPGPRWRHAVQDATVELVSPGALVHLSVSLVDHKELALQTADQHSSSLKPHRNLYSSSLLFSRILISMHKNTTKKRDAEMGSTFLYFGGIFHLQNWACVFFVSVFFFKLYILSLTFGAQKKSTSSFLWKKHTRRIHYLLDRIKKKNHWKNLLLNWPFLIL